MSILTPPKPHPSTQTPSGSELAPLPIIEGEQSEDGKRVSEEVYWQHYYHHLDFSYEWNNGILEVKPMSDFAKAQLYLWFSDLLRHYLNVHPIAYLVLLDIGFRLALPHKTSVRKPDLGLILKSNPVQMAGPDRTYRGIFDLCIESLSDSARSEIARDVVAKKNEYEAIGVSEYYILDDQERYTVFYERNAAGVYQPLPVQAGGIIASGVLPGFQFRQADLYRQPTWQEMVEDPVYQGFVLPAYVAVEQRAKAEAQARQQAEAARQAMARQLQEAEADRQQAEAARQAMARQLQEAEEKLKQAGLL